MTDPRDKLNGLRSVAIVFIAMVVLTALVIGTTW